MEETIIEHDLLTNIWFSTIRKVSVKGESNFYFISEMMLCHSILGALSSKYASSNLSRSSLSSGSISQSNLLGGMQNVLPNSPLPKEENLPPPRDAPLYERLKWSHEFDEMSHRDVALGRRIGFYKIKSDLGSGNFSKVKLANHQLTKGRISITL